MVEEKTIGLSHEFIIHPGETLEEIIEDRDMSQRELAIRTGVTEKHISTVIHGQKGISPSFARKLEYALGIEADFWLNLQCNYDREIQEFDDFHNVTEEEKSVLDNLKEVLKIWSEFGWIDIECDPTELVMRVRPILGISNLLVIPQLTYSASYRAQIKNSTVDEYVLYAWQRMCELKNTNEIAEKPLDIEKLKNNIDDIKQVMFMHPNVIEKNLKSIFSECGITFSIVPNFKGAPVQGFIKSVEDGRVLLCMTLRQKFADIFWFTLFHEISHIISGDAKKIFIDFDSVESKNEDKMDEMAKEFLINSKDYKLFVERHEYKTQRGINEFAQSQGVKPFIVEGRLMHDHYIDWGDRVRYKWA